MLPSVIVPLKTPSFNQSFNQDQVKSYIKQIKWLDSYKLLIHIVIKNIYNYFKLICFSNIIVKNINSLIN